MPGRPQILPRFDPQRLPVERVDSHLPAVPSESLALDALRARFRSPPAWTPEALVERRFVDRAPAAASVLVPLVVRTAGEGSAGCLSVLFTQRTEGLSDHPGQVSFPGGRAEPADPDPVHTALREAEEEIGLPFDAVEVLGSLPLYVTGTGFHVTPVVGLVHRLPTLRPDPREVADVFEVPLPFLMTPAHHRHHSIGEGDDRRSFLSMPWPAVPADMAEVPPGTRFIWGATAGMLRNLYRFLAASS